MLPGTCGTAAGGVGSRGWRLLGNLPDGIGFCLPNSTCCSGSPLGSVCACAGHRFALSGLGAVAISIAGGPWPDGPEHASANLFTRVWWALPREHVGTGELNPKHFELVRFSNERIHRSFCPYTAPSSTLCCLLPCLHPAAAPHSPLPFSCLGASRVSSQQACGWILPVFF